MTAKESLSIAESRFFRMLPAVLLMRIAKHMGLAKPAVRFGFKQMFSQKMMAKSFAGYAPTRHDVFVATFGKSGTNWMMQIAQQISYRGEAEFRHIHDVVPWPDSPAAGLIPLDDLGPLSRSPTNLRVIKTHLDTDFVPYSDEASYLTVLRDPKEVLVSSYYFLGGMLGVLDRLSFADWFALSMEPGALASAWASHTASFWAWRHRPNVLVLLYGQIKRDPASSIRRVAQTMGVDLTESQLQRIVERASLAHMKAHESQFAPPRLPLMKDGERPLMVRRGESGGSDELMDHMQKSEVDALCQAELIRLGSDFPYDTTFDPA